MPSQLTDTIIGAAIEGFEGQKQKIDIQIAELRAMLSGNAVEPAAETDIAPVGKNRKVSAATLKRMREAQQARWAKVRGETPAAAPAVRAAKPKRRLSPDGRANIIAAIKKRWATKKALAKK